jgi:putative aldouronate transport system permease protein
MKIAGNERLSIRKNLRKIWACRAFYAMMAVGVAYFVVFKYATLYGLVIAFKDYRIRLGIMGSPWVGFSNFPKALGNRELPRYVYNTLLISFARLIFSFPAPIILALLLNELKSHTFKRVIQSVLYLPYFLSWIILAGIFSNLFSVTSGVFPIFFKNLGIEMPSLIADPKYFIPFLIGSEIWKNTGWGTIIYLAAISGIDAELYESAVVDGCSRFQQVIHITLPCIAVTVVTLLVLTMGGIMNAGFDQIFNLQSARTVMVSEILDTYLYRLGITSGRYEYSAIIGMFKSVINCILLFSVNWIAGKISDSSPL